MDICYNLTRVSKKLNCAGVYMITCMVNGKNYIGQTSNIYSRALNHAKCYRSNKKLKSDIELYGADKFLFQIIELTTDTDVLRELEAKYISDLKSYDFNFGYNIHRFTNRKLFTEEIKRKVNGRYPRGMKTKIRLALIKEHKHPRL